MKNSYVCPSCKEKQENVIQWQTVSIGHTFNLNANIFESKDKLSDSADHENFACPSCGEELTQKLIDKLNLWERI